MTRSGSATTGAPDAGDDPRRESGSPSRNEPASLSGVPAAASSDLTLDSTLPVMGVPVLLHTDSPELIRAFEETLAPWGRDTQRSSDVSIEGWLRIARGDEGPPPPPVMHAFPGADRVLVTTRASSAESDPLTRSFRGSVSAGLVATGDHFRRRFLETLVLSIVRRFDRHPVHASAVARGDAALLFIGPSGTGKSTLAYAAARAGLDVLSEDTVFVQRSPGLRVWGRPGAIHLPADATRHFPELSGLAPVLLPTGKFKLVIGPGDIALATERTSADRVRVVERTFVDRARVCIVTRSQNADCTVEPLGAAEIEEALMSPPEPGFDHFSDEERRAVARSLAAPGGWKLCVGPHPGDAVGAMREMLDRFA
jgi:hypothetical protein